MEDRQFARLLAFFGYSWNGYRRVRRGVKKRAARHMSDLGCRNMDEYLEKLEGDPDILAECRRRLTVSISRFFRDPVLWEILEKRVMPEIAGREWARVWFAGCAAGEEVYSFRILWEEFTAGNKPSPRLSLTATDLVPEHLERAQKSLYPGGALRDVDNDRLEKWFYRLKKDLYALKPSLKRGIDFRVHDLVADDPPEKELDIVFLRNNLLTYCSEELFGEPLIRIIEALRPDAFLVIGAKEIMPESAVERVTRYDGCVYRKT